jgi:hypothetical protein
MPRWEYMTLSYNYSYGSTTYEVNGAKEVRLKNKPLHETLTLLGQQGWELVGIAGAEAKLYILKRPVFGPAGNEVKP